jgi:hypothetical protein
LQRVDTKVEVAVLLLFFIICSVIIRNNQFELAFAYEGLFGQMALAVF